jgi:hypothetical protein
MLDEENAAIPLREEFGKYIERQVTYLCNFDKNERNSGCHPILEMAKPYLDWGYGDFVVLHTDNQSRS